MFLVVYVVRVFEIFGGFRGFGGLGGFGGFGMDDKSVVEWEVRERERLGIIC